MNLAEIFPPGNIIPALEATEKREVIRELLECLCRNGTLHKKEMAGLERALVRREELGTTGIGRGLAVPHAKHAAVQGVVGVFGRSFKGVEFEALDGQKVDLIFLLVSSPDAVEGHIEALRKITALFRDHEFCSFLRRARDAGELAELFREADQRLAG